MKKLILLLIVMATFLFSGCACNLTIQKVTAPIIAIRYMSEIGNYMVVLEGRKAEIISQDNFKITILLNSKPTLTFVVKGNGLKSGYEFIFSDYEQAKKHLNLEPGKDAQIYAQATSKSETCFIGVLMK